VKPYEIREPIWKSHSVGVALSRISEEGLHLEITYTNRDGSRLFPDTYFVTRDFVRQYPVQYKKGLRPLPIIPINDLPLAGTMHAYWGGGEELTDEKRP